MKTSCKFLVEEIKIYHTILPYYSKIPESSNKIIFENTPGNQNLSKIHHKKDNRTVSVNACECLYI